MTCYFYLFMKKTYREYLRMSTFTVNSGNCPTMYKNKLITNKFNRPNHMTNKMRPHKIKICF